MFAAMYTHGTSTAGIFRRLADTGQHLSFMGEPANSRLTESRRSGNDSDQLTPIHTNSSLTARSILIESLARVDKGTIETVLFPRFTVTSKSGCGRWHEIYCAIFIAPVMPPISICTPITARISPMSSDYALNTGKYEHAAIYCLMFKNL
jgi:hypothetical protein